MADQKKYSRLPRLNIKGWLIALIFMALAFTARLYSSGAQPGSSSSGHPGKPHQPIRSGRRVQPDPNPGVLLHLV